MPTAVRCQKAVGLACNSPYNNRYYVAVAQDKVMRSCKILLMTTRIPSSLKWLIDRYQDHRRLLAETEELIAELEIKRRLLKESLVSLANVIDIHEVPISASDIRHLRKNRKRTSLSYGQITRFTYQYFSTLPEQQDASVSEVFYFILKQSGWNDFDPSSISKFRKAVRQRLQNMAYQGKLERTCYGSAKRDARYRALAWLR